MSLPPPRRKPAIPTRRTEDTPPGYSDIQPNREFETIDEMNKWVKENFPTGSVIHIWNVSRVCCVIRRPDKKESKV